MADWARERAYAIVLWLNNQLERPLRDSLDLLLREAVNDALNEAISRTRQSERALTAEAVRAERERCAKIADKYADNSDKAHFTYEAADSALVTAQAIALAIRAAALEADHP